MTDGASRFAPVDAGRARPAGPAPTIWLVSGVLTVSDTCLPAVLHKFAERAELCLPGGLASPAGGIILDGRLKLALSITVPREEQLPLLVEAPTRR